MWGHPGAQPLPSSLLNVEEPPSKKTKKTRVLGREQRTPEPQIHAAEERLFYFSFSQRTQRNLRPQSLIFMPAIPQQSQQTFLLFLSLVTLSPP